MFLQYFITIKIIYILFLQINSVNSEVSVNEGDKLCVDKRMGNLLKYFDEIYDESLTLRNVKFPLNYKKEFEILYPLSSYEEINNQISPFGSFYNDWNRLRILYDSLLKKSDGELKKLFIKAYDILLIANERVNPKFNQTKSKNHLFVIDENNLTEFNDSKEVIQKSYDKNFDGANNNNNFSTKEYFEITTEFLSEKKSKINFEFEDNENFSNELENFNNRSISLSENLTVVNEDIDKLSIINSGELILNKSNSGDYYIDGSGDEISKLESSNEELKFLTTSEKYLLFNNSRVEIKIVDQNDDMKINNKTDKLNTIRDKKISKDDFENRVEGGGGGLKKFQNESSSNSIENIDPNSEIIGSSIYNRFENRSLENFASAEKEFSGYRSTGKSIEEFTVVSSVTEIIKFSTTDRKIDNNYSDNENNDSFSIFTTPIYRDDDHRTEDIQDVKKDLGGENNLSRINETVLFIGAVNETMMKKSFDEKIKKFSNSHYMRNNDDDDDDSTASTININKWPFYRNYVMEDSLDNDDDKNLDSKFQDNYYKIDPRYTTISSSSLSSLEDFNHTDLNPTPDHLSGGKKAPEIKDGLVKKMRSSAVKGLSKRGGENKDLDKLFRWFYAGVREREEEEEEEEEGFDKIIQRQDDLGLDINCKKNKM